MSSGRSGFTSRMLYLKDRDVIMLKHIYIYAFSNTYLKRHSTDFIVCFFFWGWTHALAFEQRCNYFVRYCHTHLSTNSLKVGRHEKPSRRMRMVSNRPLYLSWGEGEEENVNTTEDATVFQQMTTRCQCCTKLLRFYTTTNKLMKLTKYLILVKYFIL